MTENVQARSWIEGVGEYDSLLGRGRIVHRLNDYDRGIFAKVVELKSGGWRYFVSETREDGVFAVGGGYAPILSVAKDKVEAIVKILVTA